MAAEELDVNIALETTAISVPPVYGFDTAAGKYINLTPYVTPKSVILFVESVNATLGQAGEGATATFGIAGQASQPPGPIKEIVAVDWQVVATLVIVTI